MARWLITLLVLLWPAIGMALESAPVRTARTTATLVTAPDRLTPGQTLRVALRLRLADGWHTYWKNPGDAGAPVELTLALPDGAQAGPIEWAAPARMPEGDLMTYGYAGEVLFPVTVTGLTAPARIVAEATWLVCKDICVPEEGRFVLDIPAGANGDIPAGAGGDIPAGAGAPGAQAGLFAAHDARLPRAAPWTARIDPSGRLEVTGAELGPAQVKQAWFIPDRPDVLRHEAPQDLTVAPDRLVLALRLTAPPTQPITGLLSIRDAGGRPSDFTLSATPGPLAGPAPDPSGGRSDGLMWNLLFALLGGLILNLMPCVFPVLAMKAVALANGSAGRQMRLHALSYTAGVMTTFAALGLGLAAARAGGAAIGWGFQFQSPLFLVGMTWLMLLIGLNLSGVFHIAGRIAGAGGGLASRQGHAGSFFTGLLAVLVATPCTAPFMGSALAAGLAAPVPVTLAIFLALGLGLALPYVVLALWPALGRTLPRPGPWMERLRQVLAFPMYGTAVWLLWVVSQSSGPDGVLVAGTGAVLLALGAWSLGITQGRGGRSRSVGLAVLALTAALSLALLNSLPPAGAPAPASAADAWSEPRLAELRQQGRPVFVNMTAAWCVTCLVNERVALGTGAVRARFAEQGITLLKGDWTRHDPAITAYLRRFDRDGVPLYVFYPGGGAEPVVLPQILTELIVIAAITPPRGR